MHKNNRGGVAVEGGLHDFAGMDGGLVNGAFKEVLFVKDAVGFVEEEDFEDFPLPVSERCVKIIQDGLGITNHILSDDFLSEGAVYHFLGGKECCDFRLAQAFFFFLNVGDRRPRNRASRRI